LDVGRDGERSQEMGFMEPEVTERMAGWRVETTHGTWFVPGDVESSPEALADYVSGEVEDVEPIKGYFGRMSAPGYLDATDWTFGETAEEVWQELAEYYGKDDAEVCETCEQVHVDYPHEPGYLDSCGACRDTCHCGPGVVDGSETECVAAEHDEEGEE
jgi:hypothetical protein